jgi:adenylate cyclase
MSEGKRRLVAIMFTDMVGYTALGQRDESLSLALVEAQRKLVRPVLAKHGGREVKTIGDAFLVEFPNATDAVRCAYDIQRTTKEFNLSLDSAKRIHLRIGLHLGEVIEHEGDISGDAVNVASRIEPLAEDGGICLTRQVYDHVKNKLDFQLSSLGLKTLKNVIEPIEVFKLTLPWSETEKPMPAQLDKRRIAVLPFASLSPDPNDEYFADGLTEELITTLSKLSQLTVIARTSVMVYKGAAKRVSDISRELNVGTLVEGSVRKAGNKLRITVQLLDSATEGHIWAENFDKQLDDIFDIQTEIAEGIANELQVQLGGPQKKLLEKRPTVDTDAYILYLKGRHYWNERSVEGVRQAIVYFEKSIEKDPRFALGYSGLADCYQVMARNRLAEFGPNYEKAREYVTMALEIDPDLAEAHTTLGAILHYYLRDWKASEREFRRALELKPSYATAHQWFSHVLFQQKRFEEADKELLIAHELDPFSLAINHNLAGSYYFNEKFDEAIERFERLRDINPSYLATYVGPPGLIQAYVRAGMYDKALSRVEDFALYSRSPREVKLWRAYVLASMGKNPEANALLKEVEGGYETEYISPYFIGLVRFILGDVDDGFQWFETAYSAYDGNLNMIAVDFELREIRNDHRFLDILNKIGLGKLADTTQPAPNQA